MKYHLWTTKKIYCLLLRGQKQHLFKGFFHKKWSSRIT